MSGRKGECLMKKTLFALVALAVIVVGCGEPALAKGGGKGGGKGAGGAAAPRAAKYRPPQPAVSLGSAGFASQYGPVTSYYGSLASQYGSLLSQYGPSIGQTGSSPLQGTSTTGTGQGTPIFGQSDVFASTTPGAIPGAPDILSGLSMGLDSGLADLILSGLQGTATAGRPSSSRFQLPTAVQILPPTTPGSAAVGQYTYDLSLALAAPQLTSISAFPGQYGTLPLQTGMAALSYGPQAGAYGFVPVTGALGGTAGQYGYFAGQYDMTSSLQDQSTQVALSSAAVTAILDALSSRLRTSSGLPGSTLTGTGIGRFSGSIPGMAAPVGGMPSTLSQFQAAPGMGSPLRMGPP